MLESCLQDMEDKTAFVAHTRGVSPTLEAFFLHLISCLPTLSLELSTFSLKKKKGLALSPESLSYKDVSTRE